VRRFGTFTADLDPLADWLLAGGVTTVAMESTGVYWIPVCELLEARGLQGLLSDPRQAKRAPGRPKTDRLDCQWLQRLHSYGLLAGAFRPADQVCVLRGYLRHRHMLLTYAAHHIPHMHKALQHTNLKLTQVVSDITGVTGMAILKALLAGERNPPRLAQLRHPHCHHDTDAIAKALQGNGRAEHLFALRQAVELYDVYPQQITQCDQQIKRHLETCGDHSDGQPLPPKARRHKKRNAPRFEARTSLYRMAGVDLTIIEGIEEGTALVILSEIGTDMTRWPSVKHFCSWLGRCPQHKIAGGKVLSRRVRPGAHRVTVALRLAARSLHHSQSALGAFFRRMKARLGTPKAITATAPKLARLIYSLLKHGTAYVQQGLEAYATHDRERTVKAMARHAKTLGYALVPLAEQGSTCWRLSLGQRKTTTPQDLDEPTPLHWGNGGSIPSHPHRTPQETAYPPLPVHLRRTLTGKFLGRPRFGQRDSDLIRVRPRFSVWSCVMRNIVTVTLPAFARAGQPVWHSSALRLSAGQ
jgi:transposase